MTLTLTRSWRIVMTLSLRVDSIKSQRLVLARWTVITFAPKLTGNNLTLMLSCDLWLHSSESTCPLLTSCQKSSSKRSLKNGQKLKLYLDLVAWPWHSSPNKLCQKRRNYSPLMSIFHLNPNPQFFRRESSTFAVTPKNFCRGQFMSMR